MPNHSVLESLANKYSEAFESMQKSMPYLGLYSIQANLLGSGMQDEREEIGYLSGSCFLVRQGGIDWDNAKLCYAGI